MGRCGGYRDSSPPRDRRFWADCGARRETFGERRRRQRHHDGRGRIDPDCRAQRRLFWWSAHDRVGMSRIGCRQDGRALAAYGLGMTVVDHRRRQQPDATMVMRGVVPGEERVAEGASLLYAAEPTGE